MLSTFSAEPYSSKNSSAIDLDTYTIWLFLRKDHELRTERMKVQLRHFLNEFFPQEVDGPVTILVNILLEMKGTVPT